jgi:hypothetical protein
MPSAAGAPGAEAARRGAGPVAPLAPSHRCSSRPGWGRGNHDAPVRAELKLAPRRVRCQVELSHLAAGPVIRFALPSPRFLDFDRTSGLCVPYSAMLEVGCPPHC